MTSKLCPVKKTCFDKGTCETCGLGIAFDKCAKKIKRLNDKNKMLKAENAMLREVNEELNLRIDHLLFPEF